MPQQPRRRTADHALEPDIPVVVTLKDYVDVRVTANDKRVDAVERAAATAVSGLTNELDSFKAEIRSALRDVASEVSALRVQRAESTAHFTALQKLGVFIVGFVAVVAPIVSLFVR